MIEWIEYTETAKNPPQNRALLVYCPDFSSSWGTRLLCGMVQILKMKYAVKIYTITF